MAVLVILSLCTRAPSNGTGGGGKGSICVAGLSTVHFSISKSPRDSDDIVDCLAVPPVLMFYPPDLARFEYRVAGQPWAPEISTSFFSPSVLGIQISFFL